MSTTPSRSLLSTILFVAAALAGCSDDDDTTTDGATVAPFSCLDDNVLCDPAAHEICVYERYAATLEAHAPKCVVAPATCADCDCATDAAVASFDGGSNCNAAIECSQTDAEITVACTNPFI